MKNAENRHINYTAAARAMRDSAELLYWTQSRLDRGRITSKAARKAFRRCASSLRQAADAFWLVNAPYMAASAEKLLRAAIKAAS